MATILVGWLHHNTEGVEKSYVYCLFGTLVRTLIQ